MERSDAASPGASPRGRDAVPERERGRASRICECTIFGTRSVGRLRATNVSLEDREDLLGHKSDRVTTDYSAPEIRNLIQAANQVIKSRNSPELTVLRVIQAHVSH